MPERGIPFLDPDQNLVAWLDRHIFPYHLYEDWTTHNLRDPEGLLSDLPAVATALLGLLAGLWLRSGRAVKAKTAGLAVGAAACLASGYLWSLWFPLNKKMWTSSYVLVAAGWSLALLTLIFWAVEQKDWRKRWTWVWLVFGSNAIVAYMVSELLPSALDSVAIHASGRVRSLREVLAAPVFAQIHNPGWAAFAYSVSFTAVCFVPVWVLYRKKIFVKV